MHWFAHVLRTLVRRLPVPVIRRSARPHLSPGEVEDADPLPMNLEAAVELAKGSELMTRVLGEYRKEILIGQAERELEFLGQQVTPVEVERYMGNF